MSPPGRPKGEPLSAQRAGKPMPRRAVPRANPCARRARGGPVSARMWQAASADGTRHDCFGYALLRADWEGGVVTPVPWDDAG